MIKYLKIAAITLCSLFVLASLSFWLILPNVVDLNPYKEDVQKMISEQVGLNLDFDNIKLITTPIFGIGAKIDNLKLSFQDKTEILNIPEVKARVALPSLLFLTVKVSNCEIKSPSVNFRIEKNGNFKILNFVEDFLNNQEKALETGTIPENNSWFNPEWIRIKIPAIVITDYNLKVTDLNTKHFLDLRGEKAVLAYNGKRLKVKTYSELYSDNDKNITANIDINSFIPQATKYDKEDDESIRVEFPKINPVALYRDYNLKANIDTKLKIRARKNGTIVSKGYVNIDDITYELASLRLPPSYLRLKTRGTNVFADANLYLAKDSKINLLGKYNYGKHHFMDISLNTDKIHFSDIVLLFKSSLDNVRIKNDVKCLKGMGYFQADTKIKTNFKKLKSEGSIVVKDGGIINTRNRLGFDKCNMNIDLSNNMLTVSDSNLNINGAKVNFSGNIDEKSVADIQIKTDAIKLPVLYRAFAPNDLKRSYDLLDGTATVNMDINGKLKNVMSFLKLNVTNLVIADRKSGMRITDKTLTTDLKNSTKFLEGTITNKNFNIYIPQTKSSISIPDSEVIIDSDNIIVNGMDTNINKASKVTTNVIIKDYMNKPQYCIKAEGNLDTSDLKQLIGKEAAAFVAGVGVIPLNIDFDGNNKKQTLYINLSADANNYITPVNISKAVNRNTFVQATVDFKQGRMKIKDTGFYILPTQEQLEANPDKKVPPETVLSVEGTIAGDNINLIKVKMPEEIQGDLAAFKNSFFKAKTNLLVFGKLNAPRIRGLCRISEVLIPELYTKLDNLLMSFRGHSLNISTENLTMNGSDLKIDTDISLVPESVTVIDKLIFTSNLLNLDKLMVVSDNLMKKLPPSSSSNTSTADAHIPVAINRGNIDIRHLSTGNIIARNIYSDISMRDDVFYLRGLRTSVFDGHARGNIAVNLINMGMDIDLKGDDINVDKALIQAAGLKDTLSGTAKFNTNIKLKGATYEEQMKTLNGNVEFEIKEGQLGPFGKLENFILAENIRESQFFQTALGGVIDSIATIDTTHFDTLAGVIDLVDGVVDIKTIGSKGNTLCLNVFGNFDILANTIDTKVRTRLASNVSDMLGPIAAVNPINLVKKTPGLNIAMAKAFTLFTETVTQDEIDQIPNFEGNARDENATKFQIVIKGDVAKPLTLVKSFKWLALQSDIDNAKSFVDKLPTPKDPNKTLR